jgi:hypothetical protein
MRRTTVLGLLVALSATAGAAAAHAGAITSAPPLANNCTLPSWAGGPANGGPASNQAYIYTVTNPNPYGNPCYVLTLDTSGDPWTSWDASTGFPNDVIQAAVTGPSISLVLTWNSFNTKDNGGNFNLTPSQYASSLGSWNRQASAARLQTFNPGNCGGTAGRLVVWTDPGYSGDCSEYPIVGQASCYSTPIYMGFRNDTTSSAAYTGSIYATLYTDSNFNGGRFSLSAGQWSSDMRQSDGRYDDIISSAGIGDICRR